MKLFDKLVAKEENLALVGLGYVGMPIAHAFAKKGLNVIGFDLNKEKIELYKSGIDPTKEVGDEEIKNTKIHFTADETELKKAKFVIVAVPTPVNTDHTPDLTPVIGASEIVGRNLTPGAIVVYESTVYPGCTEDVCIPILEKESGLKSGVDFKIGYSPERINPGDKVHRLENIHKIVSGIDAESLEEIKAVYDLVIEVGTHPVSNLRTAEAVKVVENSQRDINIAFMNELAMVFDRMDIDTNEVVDGMNTKWNALGFRPGLVGGHCIGVDPYYFTYQAEKLGYHSQIILNGRIVNDSMGAFVADKAVKKMIEAGQAPKKSKVVILGLTFKENCPDTRNSKVDDIIKQLNTYGIEPVVVDSWASERDAIHEYGVKLTKMEDVALNKYDRMFLACGAVFRNKGIDRLIRIWLDNFVESDACLIVGGREMEDYQEYDSLKPLIMNTDNIILLDGFIEEKLMNYLFFMSTAIVLPYRHASMSGIIFSAAQFKKPIICTDVGALKEYLEPGKDSLICENTEEDLARVMGKAIVMKKEELDNMGKNLEENIKDKCNWVRICSGIVQNVYKIKNN